MIRYAGESDQVGRKGILIRNAGVSGQVEREEIKELGGYSFEHSLDQV